MESVMNLAKNNDADKQVVVFKISDEEFCVNIMQVREIIHYQEITKIPDSIPSIEGFINVRDKIVVVFNLSKKFSMGHDDYGDNSRIVIIEVDGKEIGILADCATEVVKLKKDQLKPAPDVITKKISKDFIENVGVVGERNLILLDFASILNDDDHENIKHVELAAKGNKKIKTQTKKEIKESNDIVDDTDTDTDTDIDAKQDAKHKIDDNDEDSNKKTKLDVDKKDEKKKDVETDEPELPVPSSKLEKEISKLKKELEKEKKASKHKDFSINILEKELKERTEELFLLEEEFKKEVMIIESNSAAMLCVENDLKKTIDELNKSNVELKKVKEQRTEEINKISTMYNKELEESKKSKQKHDTKDFELKVLKEQNKMLRKALKDVQKHILVDEKLLDYILTAMQKGFDADTIAKKLVSVGWEKKHVNAAFNKIKKF